MSEPEFRPWERVEAYVDARLAAQDELNRERVARLEERIDKNREMTAHEIEAMQLAVDKAEGAVEKRFESVNEWRGQSLDRERSQAEDRTRMEQRFMLREVSDARFNDLASKMDGAMHRLDTMQGEDKGAAVSKTGMYGALAAAVSLISVIILVANLLTSK